MGVSLRAIGLAAGLSLAGASALLAQGFVGEVENVPGMMDLMASDGPSWREAGAWMITFLGPRAWPSAPVLVARLGDPEASVRDEASRALERMGIYAVEELIKGLGSKRVRRRGLAARTLGRIGAPAAADAIPRLRELVGDPVPEVRHEAFTALRRITGERR